MIGEVLDRRYRIDAMLGSGAMGVVYRATHTLIGKQMAIKVLRSELARDPEVVERFLREARLASAIEHPHVVDLSDFGQLPDGRVFYVMELLEGRSLAEEIDASGSMPVGRALRIALQIARGLSAAHRQGIVHRDLKSDNVFLCRASAALGGEDHVKLFDFGIARMHESKLTRPGAVLGTPEYMPPEQTMGQTVDARADIYALGVILFEMLTGRVPFRAPDIVELFHLTMWAAPPRLGELAPQLASLHHTQALVDRLLAKRPDDRPADVDAVQHELLAAIASEAMVSDAPRTTKAMGSGPVQVLARDAPVLADLATPPVASAPADPPPRRTEPQSLVHTPVRVAAPAVAIAAPPAAAAPPARRGSILAVTLGTAAAAALVTLGAFGAVHWSRGQSRDEGPRTVEIEVTPATALPAAVGLDATSAESRPPAATIDPARPIDPPPAPPDVVQPPSDPASIAKEGDRVVDPDRDLPESKPSVRPKKEPVTSAPVNKSSVPSSPSAKASTAPPKSSDGHNAQRKEHSGGGTASQSDRKQTNRSIDLKDPFGRN